MLVLILILKVLVIYEILDVSSGSVLEMVKKWPSAGKQKKVSAFLQQCSKPKDNGCLFLGK